MNKTHIKSFCKKFQQKMLPLKGLIFKVFSTKPGMIGFAAILVLLLIIVFATYSRKDPTGELVDATIDTQMEVIEPVTELAVVETQPVGIPATMGTSS